MNAPARKVTVADGAAGFEFAGVPVDCRPEGVLLLPVHDTLVVSDLHLEKGAAFARRRMHLPPWDTAATLARLAAAVHRHNPKRVISLGDSFHDEEGAACLPEMFRSALTAIMAGREWIWISGNHDPTPPPGLPGVTTGEFRLGDLVFRHEPSAKPKPGEIAGHLHPAATVVVRGHRVRRPCFVEDGVRMILPAFGAFTGSVDIAASRTAALFDWSRLNAYLLGADRIYPVAGHMVARRGRSPTAWPEQLFSRG